MHAGREMGEGTFLYTQYYFPSCRRRPFEEGLAGPLLRPACLPACLFLSTSISIEFVSLSPPPHQVLDQKVPCALNPPSLKEDDNLHLRALNHPHHHSQPIIRPPQKFLSTLQETSQLQPTATLRLPPPQITDQWNETGGT